MDTIPVVLAADNNYRYPLMVTLLSSLMNAKKNTKYQFIILVSDQFDMESMELINKLLKQYDMPEAAFYNMQDNYQNIEMQIKHISYATFYRLQLPELLKEVEKCIYLDVDVVVKKDLKEFFDTELGDNYIAGVKAAGYYYPEEKKTATISLLEIDKLDQYINAGVLLINLKKMREDKLTETFEKLLEKNFPCQDQDILNAACYGHIKVLPPKYNAMTKYNVGIKDEYDRIECLHICYTREEWNEACETPVIIHYADRWKPWQDLRGIFVQEWWKYIKVLNQYIDCFQWLIQNISKYEEDTACDFRKKQAELKEKLQQTYDEKYERGQKIKRLKEKVERQKLKIQDKQNLLKETKVKLNDVNEQLENVKKEKEELEKHLLVRITKKFFMSHN